MYVCTYFNVYFLLDHSQKWVKYRVSHSKVNKLIMLWYGYRFWFLLIFWILRVYEIGPFMPYSSVFIQMMMRAIYGLKHAKKFWKKNLNVPFVKLFTRYLFQRSLGCLMLFRFGALIEGKSCPFACFLLIIAWKWS